METDRKKIELAQWLLDPDKTRQLPDDLGLLEKKMGELGLDKIYREIELPLAPILEEMHKIGIKVDVSVLEKLSRELGKEIVELEKKIYKAAGLSFNLNSPQQLSEMLFEKLKVDPRGIPKRKTGSYATDAETLLKIRGRHPVVDFILRYRELFKIQSTYVEPLKELAARDSQRRIHTEFLQTGTATGRLASQNPNLQNIPIISEWGKKLREAFVV